MMDRGTFIVSIDVELSWGTFDYGGHRRYENHFRNVRAVVGRLLTLFRRYEISATWAVVGHLFLDSCKPVNGRKHPEMPRPTHRWFQEDWYFYDPCTTLEEDPLWYGKDIVERIRSAEPAQEIGSHSFSHVIFSDPGCSPELADAEFARCRELGRDSQINVTSFVFPRNETGHLSLLRKNGFTAFRGKDESWFYDLRNPLLQKAGHFLDDLLALTPRCVEPTEPIPGLLNVPGSMLYRALDGVRGMIPVRCRVRKGRRGLDRAAREKKIFHLWFHTFNLGYRTEEMVGGLEKILRHAVALRDEGKLDILPMGRVAENPGRRTTP